MMSLTPPGELATTILMVLVCDDAWWPIVVNKTVATHPVTKLLNVVIDARHDGS
jgi:hypothetical protein